MSAAQQPSESRRGSAESPLRPEEFAARFLESYRVLWLIAVGIVGDSSLAEDVVQEASIVALEKLDTFERGTNFTAWMGQMVRFIALNMRRRNRRHPTLALEDADGNDRSDALAQTPEFRTGPVLRAAHVARMPADQSALDDRVIAALNDVSEIARACLFLRTLESMEYSQIARVLDIPEGTAMSHVHRARRYLRERLSPLNESPSNTAGGRP